jgi:hypothetical protein
MDQAMTMLAPLERFADSIRKKFTTRVTGEPEDQLRAPFEELLTGVGTLIGQDVVSVGETLLAKGGGKPDFGVSVEKLLCGHAELKAPGKGADTSAYTGHDKQQWARFSPKFPTFV